MNEKQFYKLFNGIKLDECEFKDVDEDISDIQKEKLKKNLNKKIKSEKSMKKFKYSVTAAGLGIVCLIGIGATNPSLAENIPVLSSIIQKLNDNYDNASEYSKYSQVVGTSITDNGVTLTINEVLADESRLIISYTIKSDKKLKDTSFPRITDDLKVNGKRSNMSGGSLGESIDDYTYIGSDEIDLSLFSDKVSLKPESDLDIELRIRDILGVKGKWDTEFSISKEEISKNTTVLRPNKELDFPDSIVNIDKVTLSPIGTYISLGGKYKNNRNADSNNVFGFDYWIAFDDKGVELVPNGIGGGNSDSIKFNSQMTYDKLSNDSKYLTILPCDVVPSTGGGVSIDAYGVETPIATKTKKPKEISHVIDGNYPIELPQGKMGKLTIKDIITDGDITTVKYTAKGIAPYTQASRLYIKDETGKDIIPNSYDIRENKKNPNNFVLKFKSLDPNKKYTIYTTDFSNFEIREDLKFKLKLR